MRNVSGDIWWSVNIQSHKAIIVREVISDKHKRKIITDIENILGNTIGIIVEGVCIAWQLNYTKN